MPNKWVSHVRWARDGGGGMISGQPIAELGGMVRNQKRSLELAAESLTKGEVILEEAVVLMSKRGTPQWMYILMGNRGWKQEAKTHSY